MVENHHHDHDNVIVSSPSWLLHIKREHFLNKMPTQAFLYEKEGKIRKLERAREKVQGSVIILLVCLCINYLELRIQLVVAWQPDYALLLLVADY